ncbi:TLD-domain-containing protein [Xylariaceae sp. AK1471]|nr:TLD-domain-containing protein [Xylariaceae sp. AK1471]
MSRLIDRLSAPKQVCEKKVIVLSRSRIGTFSLYQALKMLGYKPYHMYEVVVGGQLHMSLFEEALRCKYLGAGKPYGKAEFDKWLAAFDVEIPQFFVEEFIEFYPNARFILTERSLESWTKSMSNTAVPIFKSMKSFPFTAVRRVDSFTNAFCSLHRVLETVTYHGKTGEDKEGIEAAEHDTLEVAEKAKTLVPKDRFLVANLEDGFGWEQICPFLDQPIPETRYPRGNTPREFKKMAGDALGPGLRKAGLIALSAVLIPVVSVGACRLHHQRPQIPLSFQPLARDHPLIRAQSFQADKFARRCYEPLELYSFKDNFRSLADRQDDVLYLKEETIARFLELPDIIAVSPVIFHMVSYIGAFPFLQDAPVILGFDQMIMVAVIMTERYTRVLAKGATSRKKLLFKSLAVYDRKLSEIETHPPTSNTDTNATQSSLRSHALGFAVDQAGDDIDDGDAADDDDELVMAALDSLDINDAFKTGDSHAATTHGAMIPADNFRRLIMLLLLVSPLSSLESLSAYADRVTGYALDGLRDTAENVLSAFINVEKSPGITFAQFRDVLPINLPYLFNGFNPLFEHFLFSKNLDLSKRKDSIGEPAAPAAMAPPPLLHDKGQILNLNIMSQLSFFIPGNELFRRLRLLYSGAEAGYSMGSFEAKVFNWHAPTILLVSGTRLDSTESRRGSEGVFHDSLAPQRFPYGSAADRDRLVFGALVRQPWRATHKECFGGDDMVLFQLSPIHDVFSASTMNRNYAAFTKAPAAHPGISFGLPPPPTSSSSRHALRHLGPVSLVIDSSFEFGVFNHDYTSRGGAFSTSVSRRFDFQERFSIDDIEVWGCGGDEEARIQRERWEWEAREAEARRRGRFGDSD